MRLKSPGCLLRTGTKRQPMRMSMPRNVNQCKYHQAQITVNERVNPLETSTNYCRGSMSLHINQLMSHHETSTNENVATSKRQPMKVPVSLHVNQRKCHQFEPTANERAIALKRQPMSKSVQNSTNETTNASKRRVETSTNESVVQSKPPLLSHCMCHHLETSTNEHINACKRRLNK